ncbi:HAMP domain-containing sensor histidine kinase [Fodinicola feengrottensis]|uniref:histidine kinase n=1 Tax=Fodinicola feengrottensis TaxID=435914 RepID=A0ABN2HXQ0_9ACTN|nr:HAMP domain-containing sensor histidine kinase [Fodinicola feengrottensis]
MRHLTLRGRLALMSAVAVAIAIVLAATSAWLITRSQLTQQLNANLQAAAIGAIQKNDPTTVCRLDASLLPDRYSVHFQVISEDGAQLCGQTGDSPRLQESDAAVASADSLTSTTHDAVTYYGTKVQVYALTYYPKFPHLAVVVSEPLAVVDDPMRSLGLLYLGIAALGVLLAASAGLVIARTGLAPVDRLTQAAEHISRTEDLSITLPIQGNDEIARLGQAFNTMTHALAESRERQRRLIEDAGHELRTPLTSMRTNVDLLRRSAATGRPLPDGEAPRMLTSIDAQLRELSDLVIDLLALARGVQPAADGVARQVALHRIVERALNRARLRGPDHRIEAELQPWFVRGDPTGLERAVLNILDNAIKFSPPNGSVEVTLSEGRLVVRDHGPGISKADAAEVFERFWRSPTARALPGSGLGLAIVAQVMRDVGGRVTLASAPTGGAVATCVFPGSPTEPAPEQTPTPIAAGPQ